MYPSVEYDFVPNALALDTNDMVHFQWTGSDYNPRRGCNDATGGPPDLNTYFADANANQNPRADRSNVVFMNHMGNNVPKDYLGYDAAARNMSYPDKVATANATVLQDVPCYDPATDSSSTASTCYNSVMRLAYLNQQSDRGSLTLRQGKNCLTSAELDQILNQDVADYHPLNCAKLNAKPYSYFDAGVMIMKKKGWYPYFSSRNNNFSNRQQIGVICVGSDCKVNNDTILQDVNPMTNGIGVKRMEKAMEVSKCYDTAAGQNGANANGVTSCLPASELSKNASYASVLSVETFAHQEGDNDNKGDGNKHGCTRLSFASGSTVESNVALAIGLLFVGLFCSWAAYYLYNRYQARLDGQSKFRYETAWQKAAAPDKDRPSSGAFSEANPGIKMTRIKRTDSSKLAAASAGAAAGSSAASVSTTATATAPNSSSAKTEKDAARTSSPARATPTRVPSKAAPVTRPASSAKVTKRYEMI